ncbi:MAG: hypothetical protein A2W91_19115 [Bacteroidetes bacterium GWF2_38_335]|nr:MAG: hypothetical protein A2W91_19115 [Bacteroidetes bacterium GWF2_38_335]HBS86325.1 hypothetical protein [Bacteroidales bacterium]
MNIVKSPKNHHLFIIIALVLYCANSFSQENTNDSAELILKIKPIYTGSIGWGDIYKCEVIEVTKGSLKDSTILLHIMVNSYDSLFLEIQEKPQKSKALNNILIGSFIQIENDLPYLNPGYAFMDSKKRTWKLVGISSPDSYREAD